MTLNDKIREYLLKNPNLMRSKYADTAKKFGTNYEQIRTVARTLRKKNPDTEPKEKEVISFQESKKEAVLTAENCTRVKSLEDLLEACQVDLENWEVAKYDIGTYEVTGFDKDRNPVTVTMFRTKAFLKRIEPKLNVADTPDINAVSFGIVTVPKLDVIDLPIKSASCEDDPIAVP